MNKYIENCCSLSYNFQTLITSQTDTLIARGIATCVLLRPYITQRYEIAHWKAVDYSFPTHYHTYLNDINSRRYEHRHRALQCL